MYMFVFVLVRNCCSINVFKLISCLTGLEGSLGSSSQGSSNNSPHPVVMESAAAHLSGTLELLEDVEMPSLSLCESAELVSLVSISPNSPVKLGFSFKVCFLLICYIWCFANIHILTERQEQKCYFIGDYAFYWMSQKCAVILICMSVIIIIIDFNMGYIVRMKALQMALLWLKSRGGMCILYHLQITESHLLQKNLVRNDFYCSIFI